jgi:hypothetical protein
MDANPVPLPRPNLNIHITLHYEFDDRSLAGFGALTELVRAMQGLGVNPQVTVSGTDTPAAGRSSQRRAPSGNGRSRPPNPVPAAEPAAASDPVDDIFGDDPTGTDDEDPTTIANTGLSPAEALDRGLTLVRAVYNGGHKREVKELQQKFAVAKFADVPAVRGHEFFKLVTALAEKTGISV